MDKDLRGGLLVMTVLGLALILAIWSYNMFGPQNPESVAFEHGYVQKVVPTSETGTTTIWVKP